MKVHPHRLRHTAVTQLLNAGRRITSIREFLGHKELNTTMIYARVHDQTAADDYYAAMSQIEKRLELFANQENSQQLSDTANRSQLLDLTIRLVAPELDQEDQIKIATQMRQLILSTEIDQFVGSAPITTAIDVGFD